MAKVIKLKQSDIEKIVEGILKEQEETVDTQMDEENGEEMALGQDDDGNFYVIKNPNSDNPEIVTKTK
jgi:hypothetical protein